MKIHTRTVYEWNEETQRYEVVEDSFFEYKGPLAGAKGGGSNTTTNTIAEPPAWQVPFMRAVLQQAKDLYGNGGPSYYPDNTVAPQSTQTKQGQQMALAYAKGGAQQNYQQASGAIGTMIDSADPLKNPWFMPTAEAMIRPAGEQMTQQILPGITDQFIGAGQMGGSRQGVAQGQAVNSYQQNVMDALSKYGSSAYASGLDSLKSGVAMSPMVQQMGLLPSQITGQVGAQNQAYQQQLIDAYKARFDYKARAPYENLSWYGGMVGNPLGQQQTSSAPGAQGNPITGAIGGGLTGAAVGSMIPGFGAGAAGATGLAALGPAGIFLGLAGALAGAYM